MFAHDFGAIPGNGREPFGIPVSHFQHVVFNNPTWDFRTLVEGDPTIAWKVLQSMAARL